MGRDTVPENKLGIAIRLFSIDPDGAGPAKTDILQLHAKVIAVAVVHGVVVKHHPFGLAHKHIILTVFDDRDLFNRCVGGNVEVDVAILIRCEFLAHVMTVDSEIDPHPTAHKGIATPCL